MAQEIQTKEEIYNGILNDYATALNVDVSELDISIKVPAKVSAEIQFNLELKLSQLQNNIYPDKAEEEILNRYGLAIINRTISPAVQGEYTVEVTGTIGSTISAQTIFVANDDTDAAGKFFILDNNYTTTSNPDSITIRSLDPGLESALSIGDTLTAQSPQIIDDIVTVTAITVTPTDKESLEDYREDVLTGIRLIPQGGSPSDYRLWVIQIPEVLRVYPFMTPDSPGDINVYVEATEASTSTDIGENPNNVTGVPTQATIDAVYKAPTGGNPEEGALVYDSILNKGRRPMGVINIYALPIEPIPVDIAFVGLTDTGIFTSLNNALETLFYTIRPYVAGADILSNKNDILSISNIVNEVFKIISGTIITYTSVSMDIDGSPESTYTFTYGQIPYIRNITNS